MGRFLLVLFLSVPFVVSIAFVGFSLLIMLQKGIRADFTFLVIFFGGIAAFLAWRLKCAFRKDGAELAFTLPGQEISQAQKRKLGLSVLIILWFTLTGLGAVLALGLDEQALLPIAYGVLAFLVVGWLVRVIVLFLKYRKGLTAARRS
jgi:membrane protease YdiL (CAAX protease family)